MYDSSWGGMARDGGFWEGIEFGGRILETRPRLWGEFMTPRDVDCVDLSLK
jgi:hypothetical protein